MLNVTRTLSQTVTTIIAALLFTQANATGQPGLISHKSTKDSSATHELAKDSTIIVAPSQTIFIAPMIKLNREADKIVKDYIRKNSEDLDLIKSRSASFFTIMDAAFTKKDLPLELKYLAVVESELKAKALSRVGAAGLWQLMPGTARILGLKVNANRDDRKNAAKSTAAAAAYLKDLYAQFDDWLLVIAAYNAGPGNVLKAIRKSGSRDFWKLQRFLPAETRGHVKHFIAVHYYFEGRAGETTLTKKELASHRMETSKFFALQHNDEVKSIEASSLVKSTEEPQPVTPLVKTNSNSEMVLTKDNAPVSQVVVGGKE